MTNYLASAALALLTCGAVAAEKPAAPASAAVKRYALAPTGNSLAFTYVQEGAVTEGSFKKFSVAFAYDPANLATSTLDVKVQIASIFTDYDDRDEEIRKPDIFDVASFPLGEYHAKSLVKGAKGIEAVGKLTVRGVTHDLRIPLVIKPITLAGKPALELTGNATVKRLDYGVGQGEWQKTDTVGDEIKLRWKVQLVPSPAG
jgi:polyisoprenoid-binding protein YceI